ncbi:MAG: hypothetical protein KGH63_03760, partial [Candidatus Micrarchaeota archaeon]|nr:hypothetical protein [Candidatus Micrarchaeota archaeon]
PGMDRSVMNEAAKLYNGNTHRFKTPEGKRKRVQDYYWQYVDTQKELLDTRGRDPRLASK